jgi:hypothetical protein
MLKGADAPAQRRLRRTVLTAKAASVPARPRLTAFVAILKTAILCGLACTTCALIAIACASAPLHYLQR